MKKNILIPGFALALLVAACNSSNTRNNDNDTLTTDANAPVVTDTTTHETVMDNQADTNKMADFITEAAGGGMMEVELGKLAKTHAASKAVVDFGAMMVKDHSNVNSEIKGL